MLLQTISRYIRTPFSFRNSYRLHYSNKATIELKPFKLHNLSEGPSTKTELTKEDAKQYYFQLDMIRKLETLCAQLYRDKLIRGFCHLSAGQEAIGVGIKASLRPQDITNSRGKGGSMHMYSHNFFGGNGIVGAHVPLGAGLAFSAKYKNTDAVCVTLYGDGASNQGQVFETFNISKLWNLPCIFVCENNAFGMGTPVKRASANTKLYTRCEYIPGLWLDGMDVLSVRQGIRFAIDHIKSGKGPIILECDTYRYFGHSMSDPGISYRTREEVQKVRLTRDPISMLKSQIIKSGLLTEDELNKISHENKKYMDNADKLAKASPEPTEDELCADIYSLPLEPLVRTVNVFKPLPHKKVGKAINL